MRYSIITAIVIVLNDVIRRLHKYRLMTRRTKCAFNFKGNHSVLLFTKLFDAETIIVIG